MVWLLLNIALITLAYLLPCSETALEEGYDLSKKHRKRICVVGSLGWILLSGLRGMSIGADTVSYRYLFDAVERMSWKRIWGDFYDGYFGDVEDLRDPGYRVFTKILQIFSDEYRFLLVVIAVIFFVALGIYIYKLSRNPYISYILFSCLFYGFYAFTGHRQTIATTLVVLVGSFLIKKKKLIPFLILIFIGSTIHLSCICFLPFYFIAQLPINKGTMSAYWVAIGFSFIFRHQLLDFLKSIVGYEQYNDSDGARAGTFMFLLLAVALVVTVFQRRLLESKPEAMRITINAIMTACFFVPLSLINESCMRIVHYFAVFLMIMLPELGQVLAKKTDKKFYNLAATVLMIVLLVLNEPKYEFMWQ